MTKIINRLVLSLLFMMAMDNAVAQLKIEQLLDTLHRRKELGGKFGADVEINDTLAGALHDYVRYRYTNSDTDAINLLQASLNNYSGSDKILSVFGCIADSDCATYSSFFYTVSPTLEVKKIEDSKLIRLPSRRSFYHAHDFLAIKKYYKKIRRQSEHLSSYTFKTFITNVLTYKFTLINALELAIDIEVCDYLFRNELDMPDDDRQILDNHRHIIYKYNKKRSRYCYFSKEKG